MTGLIKGSLFLLAALLAATPGRAQETQTGLNTEINTSLASGQSGGIPASTLRSVLLDMVTATFQAQGANGLALSGTATVGQVPVATGPTSAVWSTLAIRTRLAVPTNFFVNTGGSDSNTCLSSALPTPPGNGACATIQGVVNKIYSIDANGQGIGINCAASQTFTGPVNLYGPVLNPSYPAPITLNCNNSTINVTGSHAIQVGQGAYLQIINTVLKTTTSGNCLEAYQNGQIFLSGGVVFNGCAGFDMEGFGQGYFVVAGGYTISGNSGGHLHLTTGTVFNAAAVTITLTGSPTWSNWFMGLSQSSAAFSSVTFTGSGVGQRYLAHKASSIDTGVDPTMVQPETFLPGNSVGVVDASSAYLPYRVPTLTSCGTSPAVDGLATDWSGQITVGTGSPTGCNIVFNSAKTTRPNCGAWNDGAVALSNFKFVPSTTGIALTFGAANSAVVHYQCTPTGL